MKKILFLGANGVGKTHTILLVGKILSSLGKEVAIIDNAKGVYNSFNYNNDVEDEVAATKENVFREEMCIAPSEKLNGSYDYMLLENISDNLDLSEYYKVFIIQNYDKDKLIRNKEILQKYNNGTNDFSNVHFIFNQMLDTTTEKDFLLEELTSVLKNKTQIMKNEDIEIGFNEKDLITSAINKWNGNLKLKDYSSELKLALFELVNIVEKVENKEFKKIVERRF